MTSFGVLLKKELRDHLRTYKLLIIVAVFLLLGLGTPLIFNYLPSLLEAAGGSPIPIPDFTAADVVSEYLGTITQLGILVVILVSMGAVARERERGTAVMTLSKPVGRGTFIASKLAALSMTFGLGLAGGAGACYLYTTILFTELNASSFIAVNLLAGLFLLVCLSLTLLCSTLFKSQLAAGGLALVVIVVLWGLSLIPQLELYAPVGMINWGQRIIAGSGPSAWGAVGTSLGLVALCTVLAWQTLLRKEL
jgi:ABC-2 type transport system permease protein